MCGKGAYFVRIAWHYSISEPGEKAVEVAALKVSWFIYLFWGNSLSLCDIRTPALWKKNGPKIKGEEVKRTWMTFQCILFNG